MSRKIITESAFSFVPRAHEDVDITPLIKRAWVLFCGGLDTGEIAEKISLEKRCAFTEADAYHAISRAQIAKINREFSWPFYGTVKEIEADELCADSAPRA